MSTWHNLQSPGRNLNETLPTSSWLDLSVRDHLSWFGGIKAKKILGFVSIERVWAHVNTRLQALDCGRDRIKASSPCFDFPAPTAVSKNLGLKQTLSKLLFIMAFGQVTERNQDRLLYPTVHFFFNRKKHFFFFNLLIHLNKTTNRLKKQFINYWNSFKYNFEISFLNHI